MSKGRKGAYVAGLWKFWNLNRSSQWWWHHQWTDFQKTTFIDLLGLNKKKGLCHRQFCSFQCFKIWPDCLNFKHWPILSSASGALLIFTVKSTLNYTRVLRSSTKKKKKRRRRSKQLDPDQTPLYATSDQDVHGLGINLSNLGLTNPVQNKKEEAFFYHSQLNRRLIF